MYKTKGMTDTLDIITYFIQRKFLLGKMTQIGTMKFYMPECLNAERPPIKKNNM